MFRDIQPYLTLIRLVDQVSGCSIGSLSEREARSIVDFTLMESGANNQKVSVGLDNSFKVK